MIMQTLNKYNELGRPLTAEEVDGNWDVIATAITSLENGGLSIIGINLVENESGAFLAFLAPGGGTVATIPFPAAVMTAGEWLAGASYTTRDIVTRNGGTYLCAVAHVSAAFDDDILIGRWIQLGAGRAAAVEFQASGSGMVSTTVQAAILELFGLIQTESLNAAAVSYDNTESGLEAATVQAALDEIVVAVSELQDGGGSGGTDDQTAAEVPFTPVSGTSSTNVQDAISDAFSAISGLGGVGAVSAGDVEFAASGFAASNVQDAIVEVKNAIPSGGGSDGQTAADVTIDDSGWTMIGGESVQDALFGADSQLASLQSMISNFSVGAESVSYGGETVAAFLTGLDNRISSLSSDDVSHPYNGTVRAVLDEILNRLEALESA
jgi:hypothetical protein